VKVRVPAGRMLPVFALLVLVLVSGCAPLQVQVQNGPAASSQAPAEAPAATGAELDIPGARATEALLATLVTYLTFLAELCGAIVIAVAVIRGLLRYVPHILHRQPPAETFTEDIRLQIGKSLALALEFELGADILKTAVAPSLAIIAQLAAIATLRTFLNYFLERELRQAEQRRERQQIAGAPQEGAQGSASTQRFRTDQ
jgi:uncharacterized membrane protein